MADRTFEPDLEQILAFCAGDPVERVFLEDVARRGLGRFRAVAEDGPLTALCHIGANIVPSGEGCGAFAEVAGRGWARMVIGEDGAVGELWDRASERMPRPRADRPGQPVFVLDLPPEPGNTGLRKATPADLELLVPVCAAAHEEEIGLDPLRRDPDGFRRRTKPPLGEGRSWLWRPGGGERWPGGIGTPLGGGAGGTVGGRSGASPTARSWPSSPAGRTRPASGTRCTLSATGSRRCT